MILLTRNLFLILISVQILSAEDTKLRFDESALDLGASDDLEVGTNEGDNSLVDDKLVESTNADSDNVENDDLQLGDSSDEAVEEATALLSTSPNGECYKDSSKRTLPYLVSRSIRENSYYGIRQCRYLCGRKGYRYAGIEVGHECFCGNSLAGASRSSKCTYSCPKRGGCGGPWALSVYTVIILGECYKDSRKRTLPYLASRSIRENSYYGIRQCRFLCGSKGYRYAGIEVGHECFCGNSLAGASRSSKCTYSCPRKGGCGGPWALSVYTALAVYTA